MPVSKEYESFLTETLGDYGKFSFRRMFGGIGVYSGELFFAAVDNDQLFFRVAESDIPKFESHGMGPFAPIPGKPPMRTYYQVPEEILNDRTELPSWIRRAIQAALDAKKRKTGTVKKKTSTSGMVKKSASKKAKSTNQPKKRAVKVSKSAKSQKKK